MNRWYADIPTFKVLEYTKMVVSPNRGPQYGLGFRPQNMIILIMETPKRVPLVVNSSEVCPGRYLFGSLEGWQGGGANREAGV